MLIVAGSLVGCSGAILSYIMCKAMNRSFFNVILGGFGGDGRGGHGRREGAAPASRAAAPTTRPSCSAMPRRVVIVPGYGLAVARAQHAVEGAGGEAHREGHHGQVRDPSGGRAACRAT